MSEILSNLLPFSWLVSLDKYWTCFFPCQFIKSKDLFQQKTFHEKSMSEAFITRATFSKLTGTFQNCTEKCPKSKMNEILLLSHLSGFLILFTFEQNDSCLTKIFMQKNLCVYRTFPWALFGKLMALLHNFYLECLPALLFSLAHPL